MKIYILLGLIFLFSCSNDQVLDVEKKVNFDVELEIINELDSIQVPPVLFNEREIMANDDFLISMNIDSDTLFRVFNLNDLSYVGNFGVKGRGPKDFYNPVISGFRATDNGCIVTDLRYVNLIEFPKGNISNKSIIFKAQYSIPGQINPLNQTMLLNDSIICGVASISSKELVCYNTNSKELEDFIDFPKFNFRAPKKLLTSLYYKRVKISNDGSKIAIAYRNFPLIRIFNNNGEILNEVLVNDVKQQVNIKFSRNGIVNGDQLISYFSRLATTDNFIYALFEPSSAKFINEYEFVLQSLEKKQLLIFDWDGNPVLKIFLEDWMNIYTPTRDDNYLYFVHPFYSDKVYRYPLNRILENEIDHA